MSPEGFAHLRLERRGPVVRIALARSEVRNSFNDALIAELTRAFRDTAGDASVRAVVLSGDGPAFCAGADVSWMRQAGGYSREQNEADAERMARMLQAIDACPQPVIALAHGAAIGGGVGLLAAADIAIAAEGTVFSLAEVRLGILPSVISPYVVRAIGPRFTRDVFLTGDRFDAREAWRMGLVHRVVPGAELEAAGETKVRSVLDSGPEAVRVAKRLIEQVTGLKPDAALALTVRTIAERRASEEAREGLTAFWRSESRRGPGRAKNEGDAAAPDLPQVRKGVLRLAARRSARGARQVLLLRAPVRG